MALIERELKRDKLVAKYAKKHAELKAASNDAKKSVEERAAARNLQAVRAGARQDPRNGLHWRDPRHDQGQLVTGRRDKYEHE
jgi:hypothetical protein